MNKLLCKINCKGKKIQRNEQKYYASKGLDQLESAVELI